VATSGLRRKFAVSVAAHSIDRASRSAIGHAELMHRRWKSPGVGETAWTMVEGAGVSVEDVSIVVDPASRV
jgi:hypothetical protein